MSKAGIGYVLVGWMALSCEFTRIAVSSEPSGTTTGAASTTVGCVVLDAPNPKAKNVYGRVLARELFRQAFLMAARDELGLSTRDAVLREDGVAPGDGTHFDMELKSTDPGLTLVASVSKVDGVNTSPLWSGNRLRVRHSNPLDYQFLAAQAEELSRKEFPGVLKRAGLTEAESKTSKQHIPPETQEQLEALNLADQFAAVRKLHGLIRTRGQSPDLLGGLARGYAHLSVLTQTHWNVSHKVFVARSLLYAERLLAATPGDPSARAHLAYALALGGMHGLALEECSEARRLAGAVEAPAWLDAIEAACKFDNKVLEQLAGTHTPVGDLACLLRLLQCDSTDVRTKDCELAGVLLRRQPYCLRVVAMLSRLAPIEQQHRSTGMALGLLDQMIREEVSQASGLPPSATQAIKAMKPLSKEKEPNGPQDWRLRRVEAYQALVQAGAPGRDREEPSWTVLGRFLEEEYFVAAFERAWFVRKVLGISAGDQVEFFLPLLPDHPCRGFFELCAMDSGEEDTKKMTKLIGNVAVPDPDVQMSPVFRYVRRVEEEEDKRQAAADQKKSSESSMHDRQKAASDHVCRDILYAMDSSDENQVLSRARTLLKVSPHHPVAAAKIIRYDWKSAEPELGEWGKEFGNQPAFVREVARHYQDEGPPDLAEKHLKKLIELTPEVTHYRALAAVYKQLNETDKYVNTLEDALKVPELGLNQSRVRAQLADHYMDQGDYETALPYAQAAAESGAGDCLICLSRCYEGMGNMKLAERWIRECSEHYRMSGYRWFFWCKRTGFGNVEAARQLAEDCLVPRDRGHSGEGETYGAYLVLAGEPRQAAEMFQKDFELNWNPNSGLHGAVLAFKMGDRKLCGELLQKILDKSTESKSLAERRRPKIELARLLQEATRPGGTLDARQVDAILEQAPESELVNVQYFAGRFFEALGDESHAREYLLRAARDKQTDKFTHVLACDRCRQLGLEIATQPASRP